MALSLTDIAAGAVLQRRAGGTTRDVPVRFTYDGSIGAVQGRAVRADGSAVVDWVPLAGLAASGGTGSGRVPSVPQGDGYRLQLRDGASGAVVAGANAWGVGVCVAFPGQSNQKGTLYGGWRGAEMDAYNRGPKLARSYTGTAGWSVFGHNLTLNNDSVYLFSRVLVAALGGTVPVGILPMAYNSLSIGEFLPGGAGHTQGILPLDAAAYPGDVEMVFWHQGEANLSMSAADYKANLGLVRRQFLDRVAPFGRTAATMLFAPSIIEGQDPPSGAENVRRAVLEYVAERGAAGEGVDIASSTLTLPSDGLHFSDDLAARQNMRRYTQTALKWLGAAAHGGRGPSVASASRAGGTITLTVAHRGGIRLRTQDGGAPTGFTISTDGFVSDIRLPASVSFSGADKIVLTLPAGVAASTPVSVKYQGGIPGRTAAIAPTPAGYLHPGEVFDGSSYPDVSNPIYDDVALPPTVLNTSDDTVTGLPLLPLLTALRLVDGGTETVSAAYVSGPTGGTSVSPEGTGSTGTGSTGTGSTGAGSTGSSGGSSVPGTPGRPLLTKRDGPALAIDAARTRFLLTGTALATGTVPVRVTGLVRESLDGGTLVIRWNAFAGASFFRLEESSDGGVTWASWGRTTETRFSKGGLTAGSRLVRVVAMTGQINGTDDIPGSASDPLPVAVGTSSGTPAGNPAQGGSADPGSGSGANGGTIALVPNPAGTVPFYIGNYGTSAITNSRMVWAQGFALGEIPAGSRAVADAFPDLQQDMESYHPDGSLRCASFAGTYSGTLAAGANAPAPLRKAAGAPNRTGGKTLADVRALGVRMEVRDGVNGPVSRTLSLAALIDAFGASAGWTFGENALGGVTITQQGPTCIDVAAWGCLRGADGTGYDRWLRGYLLVRLWSDGLREIAAGVGHENIYGPHPLGTFGQSTALPMQGFTLRAEVFDAQGLVPLTGGGPNDPGVEQWGASNLPGGSAISAPAGSGIDGQGIPVAFSGSGAGSLEQDRVYFKHNGTLHGTYAGGTAASYSAGSGAVTAIPMLHVAAGTVSWLFGVDGERAVRGGTRPTVLPGHDTDYAARAGMFPRMDRRIAAAPLGFTPKYRTNRWWSDYHTEGTGDNGRELRVGSVNFPEASALLRPFDRDYDRFCRALGLAALVAPWAWTDHRRAQPAVVDGGPNRDDTTTYPGLGPLNRNLRYYRGNPQPEGIPGWYTPTDQYLSFLRPFTFSYNVLDFAAHQPDHISLAYYKSGDWVYVKAKVHNANVYGVCPQGGERDKTLRDGTKVRGNIFFGPQPRAIAWGLRSIRTALTLVPDAHPYKPVLVNSLIDSGKWMDQEIAVYPPAFVAMGDITGTPWEIEANLQPWHNSFLVAELSMAIKNGWTGLLDAWRWAIRGNFLDILRPELGGSGWWAGVHHFEMVGDRTNQATRSATYHADVRALAARNLNATSLTPETVPADNLFHGGFNDTYTHADPYYLHGRSYAVIKRGALCLVVDVLDRIGAAAAGSTAAAAPAALADLDGRFARAPLSGVIRQAEDPVWAFIPERQAL